MRLTKFKRKSFKKIPYIVLSLVLIVAVAVISFFGSQFFLSRQPTLISPLAQKITSKESDNLEYFLNKNNIPFSKIEVATDSSYIVFLKDDGEVDFDPGKNLESQVSSLQLILSRLTIEGKKFKRLDLRYKLPTIEF